MSTATRPPRNFSPIRDTAGSTGSTGSARFAELRQIARLNAQATAIVYRATGTVSRDVAPRLRQWAYAVRKGEISMGRDFLRLIDVLTGMVSRRLMSNHDAREAAHQLLAIGEQLIDLRLPVSPDPTPGHRSTQANPAPIERTEKSAHIGRAGWAGGELFGSDDAPHDTHDVPHELHHEWPRNAA